MLLTVNMQDALLGYLEFLASINDAAVPIPVAERSRARVCGF